MKILGFILSVVALARSSHIAPSLSYGTVELPRTDESGFRRPSTEIRASAFSSAINSAYSFNLASDEERRFQFLSVPAAIFSPETKVTRFGQNLVSEPTLLPAPSGSSFSFHSDNAISHASPSQLNPISATEYNLNLVVSGEPHFPQKLPYPVISSGYNFSHASGDEIRQSATFESSSSSNALSSSNIGIPLKIEHLQFLELPSIFVGSGYSFSNGSGGELKQSATIESVSSSHALLRSNLGLPVKKDHLQLFQELPSPFVGLGYSFRYGSGGAIKQSSAIFESSSSSHASSASNLGLSMNKEHLQFQGLPTPVVGTGYSFSYGFDGGIKQSSANFETSSTTRASSGSNIGLSVNKNHLQFLELPSRVVGSGYSFSYGSDGAIKQSSANFESSSSSRTSSGSNTGLYVNKKHLQFQELPSPVVGSGYSFSYVSGGEIKQPATFESSISSHAISGSNVDSSVNEEYLQVQELTSPVAGSGYNFSYDSSSKVQKHTSSIESKSSKSEAPSGLKIDSNSESTASFPHVSSLQSQERLSALITSAAPVDRVSPGVVSGFSFSYGTPETATQSGFESSSSSHTEMLSQSQFPGLISSQSAAVIGLSSISNFGSNNNDFLPSKPSIDFSINPIIVLPYPVSEKK